MERVGGDRQTASPKMVFHHAECDLIAVYTDHAAFDYEL